MGPHVRTSRLSAPERAGPPRAGKELSSWYIRSSVVRGNRTFSLLPDRTQPADMRTWGKDAKNERTQATQRAHAQSAELR